MVIMVAIFTGLIVMMVVFFVMDIYHYTVDTTFGHDIGINMQV